MVNLTIKALQAVNEVFKRLNILRRWTSLLTEDKYNELSKQSLNCIVCYILACYCEEAGMKVHWDRFPKIALYRAFQKVHVFFDTPEGILDEICEIGEIQKSVFEDVSKEIITEQTGKEFADFICDTTNTTEIRIFKASRKIATLVELLENRAIMQESDEYPQKMMEIQKSIIEFEDIPGVKELSNINGDLFRLLIKVAKLRNLNRWAISPYSVECSVLGHLFDTACFAYFLGLEQFNDEEKATKMFFMGVFHDLAEVWTTDIPSPIKDKIPGFRAATEKYELKILQDNLYSKVPDFLAARLKEVMFEEEDNKDLKLFMKTADYLSADSECWRQYVAGCRDPYFADAIGRNHDKLDRGELPITPVCGELHQYFASYAIKVTGAIKA